MLDEPEFARWWESAQDALDASRANFAIGWHNWSCMIVEQAAQLAVKALLHAVGRGERARGHDLVGLLEAAADVAALALTDDLRGAGIRLARHYQPTRYPDALPGGTPRGSYRADDAEAAITDTSLLIGAVDEAIAALRKAAEEDAT